MHIFYVQGGGLGHLTRIDQCIRVLNIPHQEVLIITPSTFAHYFKTYTFKSISWKSSVTDWTKVILHILETYPVTTFYIDAFPLGIKGELIPIFKKFKTLKYIYVSRILKWDTYLEMLPELYQPKFHKTLVLEYLYKHHYSWITKHSKHLEFLKIYDHVDKASSRPKEAPYGLLIHSGGAKDVHKLCEIVAKDSELENIKVRVFTQVSVAFSNPLFEFRTDVYPINKYLENALKIYTAAGFNSMHALKPYAQKHIAVAFDKLFDDQFYRLENFRHKRHI